MGEWASEPIPGAPGRWVRLIVLRANEWSPAVRAGRKEEVARAVAALDLELALDPLTAEMLEAFGWGPLGEPKDEPRGNGGIIP